jgi:hypothetical protein
MNLNGLITDQDETIEDNLPNVESDNDDIENSELYKQVKELLTVTESIQNKIELYSYIKNKSYINKRLAKEIVAVYNDSRISVESYTNEDSKVNYKETVIFMDSDINREKNTAITILKDLFEKGIDQCDNLYEEYVNVIRPKLEDAYNEIYLAISKNIETIDLNSILFFKEETNEFINVSPMTLKEILNISSTLSDIPDDKSEDNVDISQFKETIKKLSILLDKNKALLKTLIVVVSTNTPVSMS